ncbi:winged helix-turn-helix transcriptional regulator [Mobilitalea sibirica]|uniref:Winged helix-turn-helix transcriptional regulator n=1 Tax=Mobilitalea sibirica TaxID=1462919 RepID=A0A8J7H974_9FIRM|nr:helix-turn-helix domain-containing protein [Mobilitalea sibirica]MBH1940850.1 winged helix-turn-helix transcriptional regulator [Mobilitalea sibirica]
MKTNYNLPCNIAQTLNIIGDKWTLLILRQLMQGHDTFKEILDNLEGIPSNLLSNRLKSLESDNLIVSELYQPHPPRYRYILTKSGEDLSDVFNSIILWGEKNLQKCYKQLTHSDCGNKIELQYYCPTCNRKVDRNEISVSGNNNKTAPN